MKATKLCYAMLTLFVVLALLSGCAPAPTPAVVEKVVKETVVVEKTVPQTVVVEKEKVVEKETVKTVVVEKVVTPTAVPQKVLHVYTTSQKDLCLFSAGANLLNLDEPLHTPLVFNSSDFTKFEPGIAESWTTSTDGLVWTFKLRKNAKWHDGTPITAKDVEWTLRAHVTKAYGSMLGGAWLKSIAGAEDALAGKADAKLGLKIVDDYTVEVTLAKFNASFLKGLGNVAILPQHLLASIKPEDICKSVFWTVGHVGSGPFKLTRFVPDQYFEFDRFDDYFLGKPKLDKVIFHIYKAVDAAVLALEKGELDACCLRGVPLNEIDRFRNNAKFDVKPVPSFVVNFIALNLAKYPEFKDKRVRQAMLYAVDRDKIVKEYWKGQADRRDAMISQPQYTPKDLNPYPYDVEKAKALLKEANWDSNKEYELSFYYADEFNKNLIAVLQQYLAAVGIKVKPRLLDSAAAGQVLYTDKDYSMAYMGMGMPLDPSALLLRFPTTATQNFTGVDDQPVVDLLNKAIETVDDAARTKVYEDLARRLNDEMHFVTYWMALRPVAVNKVVSGYGDTVGPDDSGIIYAAAHLWDVKR